MLWTCPAGPSLAPGESAKVDENDQIDLLVENGSLAKVDGRKSKDAE